VAGALTTVGKGTLPFTGAPLWIALLTGLVLLGVGLGVRSYASRES
jgi:hypothetical protein